jgi:hypothetical protein
MGVYFILKRTETSHEIGTLKYELGVDLGGFQKTPKSYHFIMENAI